MMVKRKKKQNMCKILIESNVNWNFLVEIELLTRIINRKHYVPKQIKFKVINRNSKRFKLKI